MFLIPAITQVPFVLEYRNVEFARQSHCLIRTAIINKESFVNNIKGTLFVCLAQCSCGVVGMTTTILFSLSTSYLL
jgi:hypothetical protein